jgi:DNA mismatch repair protein MutS
MHRVVPGGADRSYGIEVGRLAGLPPAVLARAREILGGYEETQKGVQHAGTSGRGAPVRNEAVAQLGLFAAHHPLVDELAAMSPDSMTPIEALTELNRLVTRARQG